MESKTLQVKFIYYEFRIQKMYSERIIQNMFFYFRLYNSEYNNIKNVFYVRIIRWLTRNRHKQKCYGIFVNIEEILRRLIQI